MTTRRPPGSGTVRQRRPGRWELRVFLGTDPVTGSPRQATKTVTAASKKEASAQLPTFIAGLRKEPPPVPGREGTVGQLLETWLRHLEARGRAPKTLHEAQRTIETELVPALGAMALESLQAHHLDELYRRWLTGEDRDRPLGPATVVRYHALLRAALNQAVKWQWLDRNPALSATPPTLPRQHLQVPTDDEVKRLLAAAAARSQRWGILVALALATGARRGELCALRWPDVMGDMIRFRRSLYRAGDRRGEKGLKAGGEKWVAVGETMGAMLGAWRKECEAEAAKVGLELVPDAFVASTMPDGSRPINPDTFSSTIHDLAGELGMPHVHLHSLRHYAATAMMSSGIDARNAAEILGHANPALLLRLYSHATVERQAAAAAVLDRALMPAESSQETLSGKEAHDGRKEDVLRQG